MILYFPGDGWLLASLGAVVSNGKIPGKIRIESAPDLEKKGFDILSFKLWVFGQWKYIYVDDRLPTINNELIFASSTQRNVFWVALVEKAFAK